MTKKKKMMLLYKFNLQQHTVLGVFKQCHIPILLFKNVTLKEKKHKETIQSIYTI